MKNTKELPKMHRQQIIAGSAEPGGYMRYRIPGLVVTQKGTLIMYYEARMAPGDDWAPIDLLAFRSTDGGASFGPPVVLASGAKGGQTVNNPVMLVGQDGRLHFLYCVEYGVCKTCGDATADCPHGVGVFYRQSTDDGLTWSAPQSLTAATQPHLRYVIALGPGHGVCLPDGTLVVPVWMVQRAHLQPEADEGICAHHRGSVTTLYSKDNGATWQLGETVPGVLQPDGSMADHNESMCAVTATGGVMLTTRTHGVPYRALAWSPDGHSRWTRLQYFPCLPDAVCMGSAVGACIHGRQVILHVNCAQTAPGLGRSRLLLHVSADDGQTWPLELVIEPGAAGYADLAVDQKGTLYVLYEVSAGLSCNLVRLQAEALYL